MGATVGALAADSSNILNLIKTAYNVRCVVLIVSMKHGWYLWLDA